jgi:hypothetical protein
MSINFEGVAYDSDLVRTFYSFEMLFTVFTRLNNPE